MLLATDRIRCRKVTADKLDRCGVVGRDKSGSESAFSSSECGRGKSVVELWAVNEKSKVKKVVALLRWEAARRQQQLCW